MSEQCKTCFGFSDRYCPNCRKVSPASIDGHCERCRSRVGFCPDCYEPNEDFVIPEIAGLAMPEIKLIENLDGAIKFYESITPVIKWCIPPLSCSQLLGWLIELRDLRKQTEVNNYIEDAVL